MTLYTVLLLFSSQKTMGQRLYVSLYEMGNCTLSRLGDSQFFCFEKESDECS